MTHPSDPLNPYVTTPVNPDLTHFRNIFRAGWDARDQVIEITPEVLVMYGFEPEPEQERPLVYFRGDLYVDIEGYYIGFRYCMPSRDCRDFRRVMALWYAVTGEQLTPVEP